MGDLLVVSIGYPPLSIFLCIKAGFSIARMEVFYQDHFLAGYEKIFGARAYGTIPVDDHRQTGNYLILCVPNCNCSTAIFALLSSSF